MLLIASMTSVSFLAAMLAAVLHGSDSYSQPSQLDQCDVHLLQVAVAELGPLSLAGLSGARPLLLLKGVTLGPGPVEKSSGQVRGGGGYGGSGSG